MGRSEKPGRAVVGRQASWCSELPSGAPCSRGIAARLRCCQRCSSGSRCLHRAEPWVGESSPSWLWNRSCCSLWSYRGGCFQFESSGSRQQPWQPAGWTSVSSAADVCPATGAVPIDSPEAPLGNSYVSWVAHYFPLPNCTNTSRLLETGEDFSALVIH